MARVLNIHPFNMERTCLRCSKVYRRPKYQRGRTWFTRKYCSNQCRLLSLKGRKFSTEHRERIKESLKGHSVSKNARKKMSLSKKGKPTWNKGKKNPESQTGKNHWHWRGGVTGERKMHMNSIEYKLWRKSVFERDKYTCIWCGDKRGGNLEADHIKPWIDYPDLRLAIDNGRTLCHLCHMKTETYGCKPLIIKSL